MQNEMGYRWGQLEHSAARAFQNGLLNMHGWSCIEGWLPNDLVTTDIPFLSQAPIIRLISATTESLAAFAAYIYRQLLFSTSRCVVAKIRNEPLRCSTISGELMRAWQSTVLLPFRADAVRSCGAAETREEINQLTATLTQTWPTNLKLGRHMVHRPEKNQQMIVKTNKRVIYFTN